MNKRILSLLLAATLLAGSMTACGGSGQASSPAAGDAPSANFNATGYPVVNEPITITAMTFAAANSGDFNELSMLKEISEKTGVNVKFDQITGDAWTEKKNLTLAAGSDLPDLFYGGGITDSDILKYGKAGSFIPLNDLIDKYAPNIKKMMDENPDIKTYMTMEDGNIYDIPFFDNFVPENIPEMIFINKVWLDKLNLAVPTTTDELYTVLKAFKEQDPNGNNQPDEIPLTYFPNATYEGDYSLSGAFGVVDNTRHIMIKDGKAVFSNIQDGYKDYIKFQNKLYSEGLLDMEVFTQDSTQYYAKNQKDIATIGVFSAYAPELFCGMERAKDYVLLPPLKGPNGDQLWNKYSFGYYGGKALITSSNKNPEATMRWLDEQFEEEMSIRLHWGELGDGVTKNADGTYKLEQELPGGVSVDDYRFMKAPAFYSPGVMLATTYDKIQMADDKVNKAEHYKIYDPYTVKEWLPTVRLNDADQKVIGNISTDINKHVRQFKAKWITGEGNIDNEWESFKGDLAKMNVEQYVEIYQRAYDNTK